MNMRYEDVLRSRDARVILPGDPEPDWLYRTAEHQRILAQWRAEQREERHLRLHRRIVSRLRTALASI
jgi:hypothetical protein